MKRLLLLLFLPSFSLAQSFFVPGIDPGLSPSPCRLVAIDTENSPAVIALGASWEKGGFLDPDVANRLRYVTRLGMTLKEEYFLTTPSVDIFARNNDLMSDVETEQLGDACLKVSAHRDAGAVIIVGMTNDVSRPLLESEACTGENASFEGCVADIHAPAGFDGLELAEIRLENIALNLARSAAISGTGDSSQFAPKTRLILVNQFNPLDATHAKQGSNSCRYLSAFDPGGPNDWLSFDDLVDWIDFIQGVPGAHAAPIYVPFGWMSWRDRIQSVANTVASEYPNLDVEVLDLHDVLDEWFFMRDPLPEPSLKWENSLACFHLTELGHERVCRAMAQLVGVPGDSCRYSRKSFPSRK